MFRVTQPESPAHFASIFELRYRILRKPWNQPKGSERDDAEATSIHAMILDENGVCIATGRLQFNSNETGQIRFMAVDPEHRGKHLGKKNSSISRGRITEKFPSKYFSSSQRECGRILSQQRIHSRGKDLSIV